jgi:hypothetical protein
MRPTLRARANGADISHTSLNTSASRGAAARAYSRSMIERGQRMNRLLELLSAEDYDRLRPYLTEGKWKNNNLFTKPGARLSKSISPSMGLLLSCWN